MKYGSGKLWFRLDRISNSDTNRDEFNRMVENFKNPGPVKESVNGVTKMVVKSEAECLSYAAFEKKL